MIKSVTLIGAGNLATQLGKALFNCGISIDIVYSRTERSAKQLADTLQCKHTTDIQRLPSESDLYILAISDKAHATLLCTLPFKPKRLVHTAGSVTLNSLKDFAEQIGVFYPFQTFSKERDVDFGKIPLLIEASSPEFESSLKELAIKISNTVSTVSSEKRKQLHLAAVFVCNFVNHLYDLGHSLISSAGLDFKLLQPLIEETANKLKELTPREAQTGPAVRMDMNIIEDQRRLLNEKSSDLIEIYDLLSQSIYKRASEDG